MFAIHARLNDHISVLKDIHIHQLKERTIRFQFFYESCYILRQTGAAVHWIEVSGAGLQQATIVNQLWRPEVNSTSASVDTGLSSCRWRCHILVRSNSFRAFFFVHFA